MRVKAIYSLSHNLNWNECVPASLRLWSNWHSCRISLVVTRQKLLNGFLTRMRSKRKWINVHENLKLYKSRLLALKSFLLLVSVLWSVGPWKKPILAQNTYFFSPHKNFKKSSPSVLPHVSYWYSFRIIFPYYWPDTRYKNNQCCHLRCFAILQDSHSQNPWFLVVLIPARKSFCSPLIPCVKFKATKEKIGEHIFPPLHCLNWTFLDTKFTFCAYHHIIK